MDYFENMENLLLSANSKALRLGDAKAWDNRKAKVYKRHTPRGKAYKKLDSLRMKGSFDLLMEQYFTIGESLPGFKP